MKEKEEKKIHRANLSYLSFHSSGCDEEGTGQRGGYLWKYLFNILIENDKHSGAFSPAGEIKESELGETQALWIGTKPIPSRLG